VSTLVIVPTGDVSNAGQLVGSSTYFGAVDENPHDGNTTYIQPTASGQKNIFGADWTAIGESQAIVSVTVRWAYASAASQTTLARAGLKIGGTEYFAALRQFTGIVFIVSDEVFTTNPATGLLWQRDDLVSGALLAHAQSTMPGVLGYPRLSQIIAIVDLIDPVTRPEASGASLVPQSSMADPGRPTATATALVPTATATILAPTATGVVLTSPGGSAS
jgi:hypothetical protein